MKIAHSAACLIGSGLTCTQLLYLVAIAECARIFAIPDGSAPSGIALLVKVEGMPCIIYIAGNSRLISIRRAAKAWLYTSGLIEVPSSFVKV